MVIALHDFASASVKRVFFALILLAVGTPVGLTARPLQQAVVSGTVSEQGSLQPIAQALVRVAGTDNTVTTNQSGRFRIENVALGTRELQITALGYRTFNTAPLTVAGDSAMRVTITLESEPLKVERLIVTATKTAENSLEVPAVVTVVDRQDIVERGDVELVDAIERAPGLMHTAQANAFESIELRGMPRQGNEFETTLLLIDGVPQTDSRNSARVINLPIDHARSIEVVNGPNSALYGRTAIGGAINIITGMPTAQPRVSAELQAGEFGHIRGAVSASGPMRDRAGYFVSWSSAGNNGFYSGDPEYDVKETAVFAKFVVTPDDRSEAWVSVNTVTSDNSLPTSMPVVNGELLSDFDPRFDRFANINFPQANYHQEELRLTAFYTRDLATNISFTNTFSYRDIQYKFVESGDLIGGPFAPDTATMEPFSLQSDEEIFYEEARFAYLPTFGDIDDELLVGASFESNAGFRFGEGFHTDTLTFVMQVNYLGPLPPREEWQPFQFGGDRYRLRTYGLYFQYQIEPLPRVLLTAAGRYDRLDLKNKETFKDGKPVSEETFDAFSPKFSALYKLLDATETESLGQINLNLYAAYSEAFKPPRSPSGLGKPGEDENLQPEDITNYEVGLKSSFLDGRASLNVTYFNMERDGVVIQRQEGPFFIPSNAGKQDFEGVEVGAAWAPMPNLSFFGNAAFYHNRFGQYVIELDSTTTIDLTGNRLPAVPDRIFNVGGSYEPIDDVGATVRFKYVSDRFSEVNNVLLLDPYQLLDASVWWSPGPVRFTLTSHNLLDERYFTSGGSNADSVNLGWPRQLMLIASYVYN
jgi:iron complex outermembrane receptor protein|tara:strand:+ start:2995 stop:5442 length:2448 start_codon:yes stop_codon:yes gene_type:complete